MIDKIQKLGLKISINKTEAIMFGRREIMVGNRIIRRVDSDITITSMKYLDVFLNSKWSFNEYFNRIGQRASYPT